MPCDTLRLLMPLRERAAETRDPQALGEVLVELLSEEFERASWVGIYWLVGTELQLGPFLGPPTEHERIPVGRGVCGTAVAQDEDQVVDDVTASSAYIACSHTVQSEMVVLIRSHGQVVGQIDMDADELAAFDEDAHCVVRAVADAFGGLIDPAQLPAPK